MIILAVTTRSSVSLSLDLLLEDLISVEEFRAVLRINVQIVNTNGLRVLRQLDVKHVRALLIDVMHHDEIVNDLHLVQDIASRNAYALVVLEGHVWVQLVDEDLTCMRTEVQHDHLVIEARDEELMFHSLFIESAWELLLRFVVSAEFLIIITCHEHLEILVEYSWSHSYVCERLRRALEIVESTLAEAGLHGSLELAD